MPNAVYDTAREGFLAGEIDWDTAVIKVALVRGYAFSAAHKYVSQITGAGGTIVATQTLAAKTVMNGVADAGDPSFPTVPSGPDITAIVFYQASAVGGGADVAPGAQRLILHVDTATNLPIPPNGGNIDMVFDAGPNRIFRI